MISNVTYFGIKIITRAFFRSERSSSFKTEWDVLFPIIISLALSLIRLLLYSLISFVHPFIFLGVPTTT